MTFELVAFEKTNVFFNFAFFVLFESTCYIVTLFRALITSLLVAEGGNDYVLLFTE